MRLEKTTIKGITWSSISQFGRQGIQYMTTIILASILTPSDFGMVALALVVIGFLDLFKDVGMSAAIIYTDEVSNILYSSVFWFNIIVGLLFTTIIYEMAPLVAGFYNDIRVGSILRVLSVLFLISSFSILQKTLLEKELEFKSLANIELISIFFGSIVGITLAVLDYGVWSLVFQSISNNLIFSILVWFRPKFHPQLKFKFLEIKKLFKYSFNLAGFSLFNYFVRNADYLLIGKFLGNDALGHYYIIYKIMLYPVQNITAVVSRVLFPVYSKIKSDYLKFRLIYVDISRAIAFITFPMMLILFIVNKSLIHTFFGSNWNLNILVTLIMILAPVGLMQSIAATTGSIYMATGKTNYMFFWGVITGIFYVTGFLIGIQFGVIGVAFSYLIVNIIFLYPVFAIPFKFIELKVKKFFLSFSSIFISSLIMFTVTYFIRDYLIVNFNYNFQLILLVAAGVTVYLLSLWEIDRNLILSLIVKIKEIRV